MLRDITMAGNDQRISYLEERLDGRIQRVEDRIDARFDAIDRKMMWVIGIQTTALIAQIAGLIAVVNALLARGNG
jgi:hypothetical protein